MLKIGGNAVWNEWFNGLIDEVRLYNRALTAAEIQADMTTPVQSDAVAPTAPGSLTVIGRTQTSVSLSWAASTDNVGVAGYGLYRNGVLVGTSPTTGGTVSGLACGTTYTLGVDAYDQAGNRSAQSATTAATTACDTAPPTVQLTAPSAGSTVSGNVTVNASAQDDVAVAGVQFRLDGQDLGAEDTSAPYSFAWNTAAAPNGAHTLAAVARDASGNRTTSASVTVTVQNQPAPQFVVDRPITGLDQPTQMILTPDGRMLILERTGTVLVVQPGANQADATPFLQLSSVSTSDERGALGIVLDPGFASNGFFYVMYTHSSLLNRVSRFTAVGNAAAASTERVIWQNDVPAAIYHQGGGLAFGADGYLYVSVGDNLDRDSAQSLDSFNGKILRLRSDGTVPTDNPFFDGTGSNKDAIWALGLRNPFRFTIDPTDGRMLIGDVGEGSWEEVDVGQRGANYGWPTCEGNCGQPGLVDPLFTYPHNGRDASITGGFVYHGGQFGGDFEGSYFYADYAQNVIRRLTFDASGAVTADLPFVPADGQVDGPSGDPCRPGARARRLPLLRRHRPARRCEQRCHPPRAEHQRECAAGRFGERGADIRCSAAPGLVLERRLVRPRGAALSYSWTFGDGAVSTSANPSHTYASEGTFTARLAVSDGVNTTFAAPMSITVGRPPTPTITAPANGSTFQAGQLISLSGSATDPRDGTLSGSSLNWVVVFHHETHQHPGPGPFTGTTASFTTPTSGHDFTGNTSYEIVLTATNSAGLSSSTSVTIFPRKVNVTYTSSPPGLSIVVDSLSQTTPYTFDSLIGFQHTLDAPSPQSLGGSNYTFSSWSDGGARTHVVTVPGADQTLTANFAASSGPPPGLVAAYGFNEASGTTVKDASGNGNDGTIANATRTSAGKNAGALSFNGTSAIVTIPATPSLDLTTG